MHFDVTAVRLNHHVVGDDDSEFAGASYRTIGFSITPQDSQYLEFGTQDTDGNFVANAVLSSPRRHALYGSEEISEVISGLTIRCRRDDEAVGDYCRVSYSESIQSLTFLMTLSLDEFVTLENKICLGLKISSINLEFDIGIGEIVKYGWEPDGRHKEWDFSKGKTIPLRSVDFNFGGNLQKDEINHQENNENIYLNDDTFILTKINDNIFNLMESNRRIQDRLYNAIIYISLFIALFAIYIINSK